MHGRCYVIVITWALVVYKTWTLVVYISGKALVPTLQLLIVIYVHHYYISTKKNLFMSINLYVEINTSHNTHIFECNWYAVH